MSKVPEGHKPGDFLEDGAVAGYPTLIVTDINDPKQLERMVQNQGRPDRGFQFIWYSNYAQYDLFYGDRSLGEVLRTLEGHWCSRWGREFTYSPHYTTPLEAAQWLLLNGRR